MQIFFFYVVGFGRFKWHKIKALFLQTNVEFKIINKSPKGESVLQPEAESFPLTAEWQEGSLDVFWAQEILVSQSLGSSSGCHAWQQARLPHPPHGS